MVKPVDCVFFFTEHPQLTVSCCTVGAFGVCIPAVALSFDPGLKAPGYVSNPPRTWLGKSSVFKNTLSICALFLLASAGCFQAFLHKCEGGKHCF